MSYSFPPSLHPLRDFMRSLGADTTAFVTDRQAAYVAQQLLGTRVRFPPRGADMTPALFLIQKGVGISKDAKSKAISAAADQILKDGRKPKRRGGPRGGKTATIADSRPELFTEGVHIFCDGAAIPNPGAGGWGVVVFRDGVEIESACGGEAETTNNQMELTGLLKAIEKAAQLSHDRADVSIWCDSTYAVTGANEWRHKWKRNGWKKNPNSPERVKNVDLWIAIDEALSAYPVRYTQISIRWVKGHANIVGNERADKLAEMGRQICTPSDHSANLRFDLNGYETPADDLDAQYRAIMAG
jgi:ribonuclease HI